MRSLSLVALVAALALPHVALAQTPSVTPTPAPVSLTFRFDCDAVPWSCGDGPNDVRWQLWRAISCELRQDRDVCTFEYVQSIRPGETVGLDIRTRYRLFLAANSDRSDRVSRAVCRIPHDNGISLSIYSMCSVNGAACAGPANWNVYMETGGELVHAHKHIGDCTSYRVVRPLGTPIPDHVVHWGLPGELAAAPTAAATMTAPPTASLTPTVGIPTEAPTITATPTASPAATDAPTATQAASATSSPTATATKARRALLLPMLGR